MLGQFVVEARANIDRMFVRQTGFSIVGSPGTGQLSDSLPQIVFFLLCYLCLQTSHNPTRQKLEVFPVYFCPSASFSQKQINIYLNHSYDYICGIAQTIMDCHEVDVVQSLIMIRFYACYLKLSIYFVCKTKIEKEKKRD